MPTKFSVTPRNITTRYRCHLWTHFALGLIFLVGGVMTGESGEDYVGSGLLALLSLTIALMLFGQRSSGPHVLALREPDYRGGDSAMEWHEALDKSGSLLILWVLFLGALLWSRIVCPGSFSIPDSVNAPLTGLLTVGGLFFALNDLRPALHKASKDRHRGNPLLWPLVASCVLLLMFLLSAAMGS